MCKLWEETTSLRRALKVTKQEKRVLVREVKELRAKEAVLPQGLVVDNSLEVENKSELDQHLEEEQDSEGERLMGELEEQVASSIRLHEEFLAKKQTIITPPQSLEKSMTIHSTSDDYSGAGEAGNAIYGVFGDSHDGIKPDLVSSCDSGRSSPLQPKTLSLLDYDSDSDESEDNATFSTNVNIISSIGLDTVEGSKLGFSSREEADVRKADQRCQKIWSKLDEESESRECSATTVSLTSQSVVTDNGRATSRLDCPLADIIETTNDKDNIAKRDGVVYHLTFYSRKIGLQFQKVIPNSSAGGVLTEAMTADLGGDNLDGSQTTSELRRIAEMTKRAKGFDNDVSDNGCRMKKPLDAVLVCGFHGFDDSANHTRPRLGARLVAFDGVSVEKGKWTFESIRKAIQARGRPLTLSFRNDFLTMEQRFTLTRAVEEINASASPLKRVIQYRKANIDSSEGFSCVTEQSFESEQSFNDSFGLLNARAYFEDDDSFSSGYYDRHVSAKTSVATPNGARAFSEAGSSVFSTNIGPLLSNLMSNISSPISKVKTKPPSYLSRSGKSLRNMSGHHDFQSSLL